MGPKPDWMDDYDRTETNESDGKTFYGFDDEDDGTTMWYSEDGILDSVTPTPADDED
ncbi:MAG: hypothetical protein Q8882_05295 [Bacillota bacterium]|nr:hypothetical protein [Bacillota bacterium]